MKKSVLLWLVALILASCQLYPSSTSTATQREPSPAVIPSPTATPTSTALTPIQPSNTPTVVSPTATPVASATATPTEIPIIRFAIIGDYGLAGADEAAVAQMVLSWSPDLIITTGDNNYPSGAAATIDENIGQYFHTYIHPYLGIYGEGAESNRFFPSLGNHDWNTQNAQPYLDYFTLPGNERYYDFLWGIVHFFALDSDTREPDGVGRSSKQAEWLKAALAASTAPWQIVYTHYPPYSSGYHGSTPWMQWRFAEWGADAVLAGHDHTYERLFVDGIPFFVNGLGGGKIYPFLATHPGSLFRYNNTHGALWVEATPEQITFQFFAVPGILIDHFALTKQETE